VKPEERRKGKKAKRKKERIYKEALSQNLGRYTIYLSFNKFNCMNIHVYTRMKNANAVLLVVVVVVLGLPIKAISIAAIPAPRRIRASRDRMKQTGEHRQEIQ